MKHDIYFNNNSANNTYLTALAKLDNTFFVEENSSSEKFFKKEKCKCKSNCFEKIGYEWFLACQIEFESLDKNMYNIVVKRQLIAFQQDKNTNKHLKEHGLEEHIHDNIGKTPKNMNHVEIKYTKQECNYYNANIKLAINDSNQNPNITNTKIQVKTFNNCAYIAYDWAQNVLVLNYPYTEQTNYIIDEAEMPDNSKKKKGVVFYKDKIEDDYKNTVIQSFFFDSNILSLIINTKSLTSKRQKELYKEILPYVELPYRDITCPKL
ncbi:24014_t:CDS:2, partial [Cetraspora pellucida]